MSVEDIYNFIQVNEMIATSGQPTEEQLAALAENGYTAVINLAPHNSRNSLPNEAGSVTALGMTYHYIPVDWENPTPDDWTQFEQTMAQLAAEKTLIHCQANYRVTAFFGLFAQKQLGWSTEQAETFRAPIWQDSDYPIWESFIQDIRKKIES